MKPSPTVSDSESASPPSSALDWAAQPEVASGVLQELAQRRRRRVRRRGRIAASLGAAVIAVAAFLFQSRSVEPVAAPQFAPATARLSVPERRVLPDGSVVEMKDGAVIEVAFTAAERRVRLTRGEAHFEVAKNAQRPFIVTARGLDVRAVGTAFSVELGTSAVQVLVTHGEVAVEQSDARVVPDAAPGAKLLASLTAGHGVVVGLDEFVATNTAPQVKPVSEAEVSMRLAWRVPRLDFSATPLAEALPIFNAHSDVKISLGDRSLGSLQISGIIRADNVEPLLRLLEINYRISAERRGNEIVLRAGR